MDDVRAALIKRKWRQLAIVRYKDICTVKPPVYISVDNDSLLLIVTQTCDLINPSFDLEPYLEVIQLRSLEGELHAQFKDGKNSRRLEFTIEGSKLNGNYYLLPSDRFLIRRETLLNLYPVECINNPKLIKVIPNWLASRYNRTAFPDSYDSRWKFRRDKIENIIKKLHLVEDIYIRLDQFDELPEGKDYVVDIILLMDANDFDDANTNKKYEELKRKLENQFNSCKGLNIESIDLVSNASITLKEIDSYYIWDYSYLTHRNLDSSNLVEQIKYNPRKRRLIGYIRLLWRKFLMFSLHRVLI